LTALLPAVSSVCVIAEVGGAVTVTVVICVSPVPFAVADTVFVSATVELRVPVETPLAFVGPGAVRVFPLPVAASATVAPLIGFPCASFTVTVIVDVSLPAPIEVGAADNVDCEAETGPGLTVTEAVCVSAVPFAVADTVFVPATVELRVPVADPFASVRPAGCVSVFPFPVAASTTVAPLIGVPVASFTVTVIVDVPPPAVIKLGAALTVDCTGSTPDGEPAAAALISTARAPPFRLVHVAATVLRFAAHSAARLPAAVSPEGCSLISVKPAPGMTAATLLRTPKTP
jgi:hypothetical protein